MKREYPYLISSLPELIIDTDAKKFNFAELREEVEINVHKSDLPFVKTLFYGYDNRNFLNAFQKKDAPFIAKGNFTSDEIAENMKFNEDDNDERTAPPFPAYMNKFLEISREIETVEDKTELHEIYSRDAETLLQTLFYDEMKCSKNKFLREWFDFDKNLRNAQAAIVSRRLQINAQNYFVGEDAEAFAKSSANDFGLGDKIDWITQVTQIAETPNAFERERKIDLLRWAKIDEISVYNYFDIDAVLAFLAKADIVDRWISLDRATGKEMFKKLLSDLMSTCDTEKAFAKEDK